MNSSGWQYGSFWPWLMWVPALAIVSACIHDNLGKKITWHAASSSSCTHEWSLSRESQTDRHGSIRLMRASTSVVKLSGRECLKTPCNICLHLDLPSWTVQIISLPSIWTLSRFIALNNLVQFENAQGCFFPFFYQCNKSGFPSCQTFLTWL